MCGWEGVGLEGTCRRDMGRTRQGGHDPVTGLVPEVTVAGGLMVQIQAARTIDRDLFLLR